MYIVENVSTRAEEQLLCKPYSWRSELFRTNPFWRFDKVSDEIKPHNKKKEILQQSFRVLTFFCRKPFLLQFLQSPGKCSVREQSNFTNLVIGVICSLYFCFDELSICKSTKLWNVKGRFQESWGFGGKRFLISPRPPPSTFFFAPANFWAITRLEMLATQATNKCEIYYDDIMISLISFV